MGTVGKKTLAKTRLAARWASAATTWAKSKDMVRMSSRSTEFTKNLSAIRAAANLLAH
jgi:hypothetical protein